MRNPVWITAGLCLFAAGCSSTPDAASVAGDALSEMGDVTTIRYSGTGVNGNYGQALLAGQDWPLRRLAGYSRALNYDEQSSSEIVDFAEPVFGGQHQQPVVNGAFAWDATDAGPAPQPAASEGRQLRIWLTPHGFLKAALAATDATLGTLDRGAAGYTISFTALDKYPVEGRIENNLVTRVSTKIPDPVLGDTDLILTYSDYQDHDGVMFPARIVEQQGGSAVLELDVTNVEPGAAVALPVPEAAQNATVPPVTVTSTELAPGVWHLTGGSHHSLVVEFEDFITVVEGPLSDERALAVITEAKRLAPGKPIQYVVNTHHHFDHAGGLRTFVSEGATVVTHASNVDYYTRAFQAPATIAPDTQATSPGVPMFEPVNETFVITDGTQSVQVYATQGDTHTGELLVAFVPGPGILVEADSYSPQAPDAQPDPPPPNAVNLFENIRRLGLNVRTIAPIHGRGAVPYAEFLTFIGR